MKKIDKLLMEVRTIKDKSDRIKSMTDEQLDARIKELCQMLGISEEQAKNTNWLRLRINRLRGEI